MRICVHEVTAAAGRNILDEAEAQGAATVLIALEFRNGGFGSIPAVKANDAGATRPSARLVLDLGLLNFADRGKQLHEVIVASGPGELCHC